MWTWGVFVFKIVAEHPHRKDHLCVSYCVCNSLLQFFLPAWCFWLKSQSRLSQKLETLLWCWHSSRLHWQSFPTGSNHCYEGALDSVVAKVHRVSEHNTASSALLSSVQTVWAEQLLWTLLHLAQIITVPGFILSFVLYKLSNLKMVWQ